MVYCSYIKLIASELLSSPLARPALNVGSIASSDVQPKKKKKNPKKNPKKKRDNT